LNGLAIAAVVAVVLVSGMMVLLREGDPNPAPSPASGASASGSSAPLPTADTSRFRSGGAWQLPDEPLLGFIEVPAGQFTMGSDSRQDSHASANEMPQHKVTLPAFFIGKYEVTVAQYKACADDGGCMPADRGALAGGGDLPVRWVSWHEALAYCAWLEGKLKSWVGAPPPIAAALAGRRDGGAWRITLPSEAEWERAARGTDARIYPWGADIDPSKANYSSANPGRLTPMVVGTFPAGASPVGAMDMAGNVWEWTRTVGDSRYPYVTDDGRERLDAPDSGGRVVRGGSFLNLEYKARAAYREWERPGGTFDVVGFRVVLSRRRP
jgi:formylglycine-generating enzyme required for sulfatase activity